jgi:plasmid maintenance system antidote protein VapI
MALRLSDALGTTSELWIGMQSQYELWQAAQSPRKKLPRLKAA